MEGDRIEGKVWVTSDFFKLSPSLQTQVLRAEIESFARDAQFVADAQREIGELTEES